MTTNIRPLAPELGAAMLLNRAIEVLGPRLAERASHYDAHDAFVAENFAELKAFGVFAAAVPQELGGAGASLDELADFLRRLAASCGSTALALSMHTHQVATQAWRWRNQGASVEPLLRRVAEANLVLVSSGGSDWLHSSGRAKREADGYRITARKVFASGAPAGDLLITSAVDEDAAEGPTVLHFAVRLEEKSVRLLDTWRVLGMRGSGSQDVAIEDYVIPESAVTSRRPKGRWHPLFHIISMIAFPLIYSVYVGLAEAARTKALDLARRRRPDEGLSILVGEMESALQQARVMHRSMVATAITGEPGPETTNTIMIARTLVGRAAIATVEKALEVAGGAGFYREAGLDRLFRDVQAARFHPLQEKVQLRYSGRCALGLNLDE